MNAHLELGSSKIRGRNAARKLLREHGLDGVYPVPTERLAELLGYETVYFVPDSDTETVSGAVEYESKRIFINASDIPQRQQFTLAHEIGHIVLHSQHDGLGEVDFRKNLEQPSEPKEIEANRFAAELLMPSMEFARTLYQNFGDKEKTAKYFGVSPAAAKIRAKALRLE